jgi:two-component system LytT family response regulator
VPQIIFTTAYDEYAIKAFELNAIDYLLKPFSQERLTKAVHKAVKQIENRQNNHLKEKLRQIPSQTNRIAVYKGNNIVIIPFTDIQYISANDDYIDIHTQEDKKYLKKMTMDAVLSQLPDNFVRIHRKYIINLHFLKQIEKTGKETYFAVTTSSTALKISRSQYPALKQKLNL